MEHQHSRGRFLSAAAAMPVAAFGSLGAANRVSVASVSSKSSDPSPFASLKQIDAGVLSIGYAEVGRPEDPVVILLHGWPYDIHCYAEVAPLLASAGYRVIVPFLRGYGPTSFRSVKTLRTGEQAAFADDTVALMDALDIKHAVIAGFDWGARTADIVAALWPAFDGTAANGTSYAKHFAGKYSHRLFRGIGHNVPQEAPRAFAEAIVDADDLAGHHLGA